MTIIHSVLLMVFVPFDASKASDQVQIPDNLIACFIPRTPVIKPAFPQIDGVIPPKRNLFRTERNRGAMNAFIQSLKDKTPDTAPSVLISNLGDCRAILAAYDDFVSSQQTSEEN